jgi:hypothetical protein
MGLTGLVCALPPWLAVTLPLGLVATVDRFVRPPAKLSKDLLLSPAVETTTTEQMARGFPSREERPLDVVVLGATGLTGGALAGKSERPRTRASPTRMYTMYLVEQPVVLKC